LLTKLIAIRGWVFGWNSRELPSKYEFRPQYHSSPPQNTNGKLIFFFFGTGVWTQGLTVARQVLCCVRYSINPVLCWVFSDRVS
jgi:hypothetical protein